MNTEIDAREVLKSVRVPTLVLHRTGDSCLLVEEGRYVASLVPRARFVALPGVDHLPFVGDQDSILNEVEEFLLGARFPPEADHALATVLLARFSETSAHSAGSRNTAQSDAREFLSTDLKSEIEWFRGRRVHVDQQRTLALFDGPARAIRCACAIAERASWLGLNIAAGLHTGECNSLDENDPSGPAVQIATRVARAAEPGEIVVSGTVHDLVAGAGISLAERDALYVEELSSRLRLFRVRRPCNSPPGFE